MPIPVSPARERGVLSPVSFVMPVGRLLDPATHPCRFQHQAVRSTHYQADLTRKSLDSGAQATIADPGGDAIKEIAHVLCLSLFID